MTMEKYAGGSSTKMDFRMLGDSLRLDWGILRLFHPLSMYRTWLTIHKARSHENQGTAQGDQQAAENVKNQKVKTLDGKSGLG
jgi:hypothetical protein